MADELSNVNGGSSTNDSIPVSMQQADVSSRSEGLPTGYTPPVGEFMPPICFGNTNGVNNMQNPEQYSEYSREYHVGSTLNATNSMAVYRQKVKESHHDLIELMKKEKEKHKTEQRSKSKPFTRKEKVAYVTMESSEEEIDFETEVDLAELKKGPPYVCSLLKKLPGSKKSNDSRGWDCSS
ncbi:hypothetical protein Ahy_A02g008698 [Arachis hypogaea]|uniref:Uncharacterized protein n=1 Tax=Arachis hypogaea TaxID=3818 RepID=A0A445EEY5_ARAHY|nr:hypothetical protein Ahy_A02g008698 [Arachis hypogaea]